MYLYLDITLITNNRIFCWLDTLVHRYHKPNRKFVIANTS